MGSMILHEESTPYYSTPLKESTPRVNLFHSNDFVETVTPIAPIGRFPSPYVLHTIINHYMFSYACKYKSVLDNHIIVSLLLQLSCFHKD